MFCNFFTVLCDYLNGSVFLICIYLYSYLFNSCNIDNYIIFLCLYLLNKFSLSNTSVPYILFFFFFFNKFGKIFLPIQIFIPICGVFFGGVCVGGGGGVAGRQTRL